MAKMFYEHVLAAGGFSGESFDIAAGPANTGLIDVLLGVGDGALTADAPHALVSTGALGGARTLSLAGMEVESAAEGSQALRGRFFYLSIQNSDVSVTNTITVSGSTSINDLATFVIDQQADYLFHHLAGGLWRVNPLPRPGMPGAANMERVTFLTTDWVGNAITILQTGTPGAGQVGPHMLAAYDGYLIQVLNTSASPNEYVDVEIQQSANGDIKLLKAPRAPAFNGTVMIAGTAD